MSDRNDPHVADRIVPCLDGELSPREETEVREHVKSCAACAAVWKESEEAAALLEADAPGESAPPIWPAVRAKLREKRSGRITVAFRVGASLAAAAGILLGLYIGSIRFDDAYRNATADSSAWTEFDSVLGTESDSPLDGLFLSVADDEGEAL